MRIATYNVEWFDALFKRNANPLIDNNWSSRYNVTRADQWRAVEQVMRALVREYHPDRMIARGVPEEAMKLAEKRLIQANWAYEEILNTHR